MVNNKSTGTAFLFFFLLVSAQAEVLTWRANAGQEFAAKITTKESIIGLDLVTVKPTEITDTTINQEEAARSKSTLDNLQGIPSFPRSAVEQGSVWSDRAQVRFDLREFGLDEPLVLDVDVTYTILEKTEIESRSYYRIKAEWFPFWIPEAKISKKTGLARISGHSTMDFYWDDKSGCPKRNALLEETQYRFNEKTQLLVKRETTQEFKTVTDIVRERVLKQLTEQIKTQKVENVEVKQSDEGIVLSIDNIQFEAESAVLIDSEKAKLTNVGSLLSSLTDRKLNVVGHAANIAGSNEDELLKLSTDRAQSVADFMVQSGIKSVDMIVATGMGGSMPLASNDTPEGRSKNRRVEIVIMDEEIQE